MGQFKNILLWALLGSGKSEVITFLKQLPVEKRIELHLGEIAEIDDYPLVAASFQLDDMRERNGKKRLLTKHQTYDEGGFLNADLWDEMNQYLNYLHELALAQKPQLHSNHSLLIECSRGGKTNASFPLNYGYQHLLQILKHEILNEAVILYIKVTPEESRRKNDERFDAKNPHSILNHRVPTEVMENDYGCDDLEWMLSEGNKAGKNGFASDGKGKFIPAGILDNTNDLTSFVRQRNLSAEEKKEKDEALFQALKKTLVPLFEKFEKK